MKSIFVTVVLCFGLISIAHSQKKWNETPKGTFNLVENQGGKTLGYSPLSGWHSKI